MLAVLRIFRHCLELGYSVTYGLLAPRTTQSRMIMNFAVRRTLSLVLVTVALVVGVAVTPAAAAAQTLTVTVVDPRTGQPPTVGSVCIRAERVTNGTLARSVCTGTNGAPQGTAIFSLDDAVEYRFLAQNVPADFVPSYYGGSRDPATATPVRPPATITFPLTLGAYASGTLTLPGGAPAVGYAVEVRSTTNGIDNGYTTVDQAGAWRVSPSLPAGTYTVKFGDGQWAYGQRSAETATVITLAPGENEVNDAILPPPGGTPPTIVVPSAPVVVEATGPDGAVVDYSGQVSATTAAGASVEAACAPASGSTFGIYDSTVTCSATDLDSGAVATAAFTVSVRDTTAPILGAIADITSVATSSDGASVTYGNVFAHDVVDGLLLATCDHPATDAYPVGTTTVTCTAMDSHGNVGYGTFHVTVLPYLADLKVSVTGPASSARNTIGTWMVTVTNTGPSNATGILLGVTTDGISVTSATPGAEGGRVKVGGTTIGGLVWSFGGLVPGGSVIYTVTGKVTEQAGTLRVRAGATSAVPDPAAANNVSSAATTVMK
jgi:hypothetical protein